VPFGLIISSLIGAGGGILNGILGSNAATDATNKQIQYILAGLKQAQGNTAQANNLYGQLTPFVNNGVTASNQLNTALANPFQFDITQDPGYAFRLQQGQKAVEQSAAARGGAMGGGELKALTNYGQGFASNEYQNAFARHQQQLNNLFSQAGMGLQAGSTQAQGESGNLNLLSQLETGAFSNAGTAAGAGILGSANSLGNMFTGLGNTANQAFLYNLLMKNLSPGTTTGPSTSVPNQGPPLPPGYSFDPGANFGGPSTTPFDPSLSPSLFPGAP